MRERIDGVLRVLVVLCAMGLIFAFYRPWVTGPGGGVSAPQLRQTLEGPHKFLSLFKKDSRISRNHALAPYLYVIPVSAGGAALWTLWPAAPVLPGFIVGGLAVGGALYLREEVTHIPFHRESEGVGLTLRLGYVLMAVSTLRILTRKKSGKRKR
jgi:hypothetical protein